MSLGMVNFPRIGIHRHIYLLLLVAKPVFLFVRVRWGGRTIAINNLILALVFQAQVARGVIRVRRLGDVLGRLKAPVLP